MTACPAHLDPATFAFYGRSLTALNDALRAVMIDGTALIGLGAPLAIVAAWGAVSFAVALKIFRWR